MGTVHSLFSCQKQKIIFGVSKEKILIFQVHKFCKAKAKAKLAIIPFQKYINECFVYNYNKLIIPKTSQLSIFQKQYFPLNVTTHIYS